MAVDNLIRGALQRIPRGLLGFLDVKVGGTYPTVMSGLLQPTLDLQSWYASEGQQLTGTGAAIGTAVGLTQLRITSTAPENLSNGTALIVPQNEIWLLTEWLVQCFHAAAGDFFDTSPVVYANGVSSSRLYSPACALSGDPYRPEANVFASRSIIKPVFVTPGEEIAMYVNMALAAAGTPHTPISRFKLLRFKV